MTRPNSNSSLRGCKVLLIEDERVIRELIYRLLQSAGVRDIVDCASAEAAWENLVGPAAKIFHAVITDINLPGASGITLLKNLRGLPGQRAKTLPVIILSGDSQLSTYKKFDRLNISSYLIKPVSADLLKCALEKAIGVVRLPVPAVQSASTKGPTTPEAETSVHTFLTT